MKNADVLLNSCLALTFGILLVIVGRDIMDSTGSGSYDTALNFSMSASFILYAGYMLMGLAGLGIIVTIFKK